MSGSQVRDEALVSESYHVEASRSEIKFVWSGKRLEAKVVEAKQSKTM